MRIDHVCLAVRSVDAAADRLCQLLGYQRRTRPVTNTRQQVKVQFLFCPGSLDIKLIEPSGPESPLWHWLRRGEGLHHLCFLTDDTVRALNALRELGLRVLTPPQPGEAFEDQFIAFGYVGFGLNIELIDTTRRRNLVGDLGEPTR